MTDNDRPVRFISEKEHREHLAENGKGPKIRLLPWFFSFAYGLAKVATTEAIKVVFEKPTPETKRR